MSKVIERFLNTQSGRVEAEFNPQAVRDSEDIKDIWENRSKSLYEEDVRRANASVEYYKQSANVGWLTFKDYTQAINVALAKGSLNAGYLTEEEYSNMEKESELRKQNALDARRERDSFYLANKDDLPVGSQIAGGIIQTITNPYDAALQIGVGVATGGMSLPVQVATNFAGDVTSLALSANRYEERGLTPTEIATTLAASAVFNVGGHYLGNQMRSARNTIADSVEPTTATVNVRNMIDDVDGVPGQVNTRAAEVFAENGPDAIIRNPNATISSSDPLNLDAVTRYDQLFENTNIALRNLGQEADIDSGMKMAYNDYLRQSSEIFNADGTYNINSTPLQRDIVYKDAARIVVDDAVNMFNARMFVEGSDDATISQLKVQDGYIYRPGKTETQNIVQLGSKLDSTVDDLMENIMPTIKDYEITWGAEASAASAQARAIGQDPNYVKRTKPSMNTKQIEDSLLKIDNDFTAQKQAIQADYVYKLNIDGNTNYTIDDLFKNNPYYKADEKNVAKAWINAGRGGLDELGDASGTKTFLRSAYDDSVILDEMGMKVKLGEIADYDNFLRKFKNVFDESDEVIYDGNLLKAISEATESERDVLLGLSKSNGESFVNFIINSKDVLDRIPASGYNVDDSLKAIISEKFGASYKSIVKYVRKNADVITREFDELASSTSTEYSQGNLTWLREAMENISTRNRELAQESIKINQTVNKQAMLGEFDSFFTEKISRANQGTVTIRPEMQTAFNDTVMPYFNNGILKAPADGNYERAFANFIGDLKKTRNSAKFITDSDVDGYMTIGQLRKHFEDGQMGEFFSTGTNERFLKPNEIMIRDIMEMNAGDAARFIKYGSTSPFALKNKLQYDSKKILTRKLGKEMSTANKEVLTETIRQANILLENTQLGFIKAAPSTIEKAGTSVVNMLTKGVLGLTGIAEMYVQNGAVAAARAYKYGGARGLVTSPLYAIKRMAKQMTGDMQGAKYFVANNIKNVDHTIYKNKFGKSTVQSAKAAAERSGDVVMFFQKASAVQQAKFGEGYTTMILDTLPDTFGKLNNEMVEILRKNGITESNYAGFKTLVQDHIRENGLTVDMNKLVRGIETGSKEAAAFRDIYYQMSRYIGDVNYKGALRTGARDLASRSYGMFKTFSKALNEDTIGRVLNYTDIDGVSRSRLSKEYFKPRNGGYIPTHIVSDAGNFAAVSSLLVLGGMGYTFVKDAVYGARSYNQRVALLETRYNDIRDAFAGLTDGEVTEFAKTAIDLSGINPLDTLEATSTISDSIKKVSKIFETLTDEEKKAFGTNQTEAFKEFVKLSATFIPGGRVVINELGESIRRDITGDIEETTKAPYWMNPDQKREYVSRVRQLESKAHMKVERKVNKAETDMFENKLDSYNSIPKKDRDIFEKAQSNSNVSKEDNLPQKTEFAVIWSSSTSFEDVAGAVRETMNLNIEEAKVEVESDPVLKATYSEFDNMDDKKRKLFYMLMHYSGKETLTEEDYVKFVDNFKDVKKASDTKKIIENIYKIDQKNFIHYYQDKDKAGLAERRYK